jgi:hypothetical protein
MQPLELQELQLLLQAAHALLLAYEPTGQEESQVLSAFNK